ncbi:unnamed protein product [Ostreobium quekettii]|uniref:RecF/RecN/SMC N-terminal domain-containing protein n=1 Tax=Ostreobium quekettii TaxID=121088 RepID=A0A8S1J1H3_9CHLO|nr:unnamed protein product [Ostreobium quekettii]
MTDGIHPDSFPPDVHVYSGHYHRPHTVKGTNIRYVGSPYQVSMSEGGEKKQLLILDKEWRVESTMDLDLGPRHYQLASTSPDIPANMRRGDRVRWTIPSSAPGPEVERIQQSLRNKGVNLEVVLQPNSSAVPRIEEAEQLGAIQLFEKYAEAKGMADAAKQKGINILKALESDGTQLGLLPTAVRFEHIEVEGFGPFKNACRYPLHKQGIRVISGQNLDDVSSESNGAGKSMLVTAPLWAVTGRLDARAEAASRGITNSDIVNDDCTTARARLQGQVNNQEFIIERSVRRRGRTSLVFQVDGQDITKADARLTQQEIDEFLGAEALCNAAFLGHGSVTALLEANDRLFKSELGKIVELDVWDSARGQSFSLLKDCKQELEQEIRVLSIHTATLERYSQQVDTVKTSAQAWQREKTEREKATEAQVEECARSLISMVEECESLREHLERWLDTVRKEVAKSAVPVSTMGSEAGVRQSSIDLQNEQEDNQSSMSVMSQATSLVESEACNEQWTMGMRESQHSESGDIPGMPSAMHQRLQREVEDLREKLQLAKLKEAELCGVVQASKKRLLSYQSLRNTGGANDALVCDQCLQPVKLEVYEDNLCRIEEDVRAQEKAVQHAVTKCRTISNALQSKESELLEEVRLREEQLERQRHEEGVKIARQREEASRQRELQARLEADRVREMERVSAQASLMAGGESCVEHLGAVISRLERRLHGRGRGSGAATTTIASGKPPNTMEAARAVIATVPKIIRRAEDAGDELRNAVQDLELVRAEQNPYSSEQDRLQEMVENQERDTAKSQEMVAERSRDVDVLTELDNAFNRGGVPSFVLEGALSDLQQRASAFLQDLAPGMSLELKAQTAGKAGKSSTDVVEKISKEICVRTSSGAIRPRSLRQLSGGEMRRLGLALALGFSELVAQRGRLRCNLIVLDEVLGQLDREGCSRVAHVLERLPHDCVLIVGQSGSFVTEVFDSVDWVVKQGGVARVDCSP